VTDLDEPVATEREPRPSDGDRVLRSDEQGGIAQFSDGRLGISIATGSHDALAEAYSRHGTSVHAVAQRVCGDRAADVTQDVFVGLWRRPERFDPERGTLGAFLRVQAHGRAIDLLRSDGARRAREVTDHRRRRDPAAPVEDVAMGRLAGDDAWQLLSRLSDAERQAITLAYFSDHTYREVATLIGLPEGTVKSRIRAGLARLRAGLPDDDQQTAQRPNAPSAWASRRRPTARTDPTTSTAPKSLL